MPKKDTSQNQWHEPLQVFAKVSGWVVGPIIVSLFLGNYLDHRYDTKPFAFLALTAFAFFISCFGIYKETIQYMRSLEKKNDNHTRNNNDKS